MTIRVKDEGKSKKIDLDQFEDADKPTVEQSPAQPQPQPQPAKHSEKSDEDLVRNVVGFRPPRDHLTPVTPSEASTEAPASQIAPKNIDLSQFEDEEKEVNPLGQSWQAGEDISPDEAAAITRFSQATGMNPAAVAADPELKAKAMSPPPDFDQINVDHPELGRTSLNNPVVMAQAKDSIEELKGINWAMKKAKDLAEKHPYTRFVLAGNQGFLGALSDMVTGGEWLVSKLEDSNNAVRAIVDPTGLNTRLVKALADAGITKKVADALQDTSDAVAVHDPTFIDKLSTGAGSMAAFFIPGLGAELATAKGLAMVTPLVAGWAGSTISAILEASAEAGGSYKDVFRETGSAEEADRAATTTFLWNLPLLLITDKLGLFGGAKGVRGLLFSGGLEGVQEIGQGTIQAHATDTPTTLKALAEAGAIGTILGAAGGAFFSTIAGEKIQADKGREQAQAFIERVKPYLENGLALRSPQTFEQLLREMGAEHTVPKQLFAPAATVQELFQAQQIAPEEQEALLSDWGITQDQLDENAALGLAVPIPTEKIAQLPQYPEVWEGLTPELSFYPVRPEEIETSELEQWQEFQQRMSEPMPELETFRQQAIQAGEKPEVADAVVRVLSARARIWSMQTGRAAQEFLGKQWQVRVQKAGKSAEWSPGGVTLDQAAMYDRSGQDENLESFAAYVLNSADDLNDKPRFDMGVVPDDVRVKLSGELGLDVSPETMITVPYFTVNHVAKRHPDITPEMWRGIPDIISNSDLIALGLDEMSIHKGKSVEGGKWIAPAVIFVKQKSETDSDVIVAEIIGGLKGRKAQKTGPRMVITSFWADNTKKILNWIAEQKKGAGSHGPGGSPGYPSPDSQGVTVSPLPDEEDTTSRSNGQEAGQKTTQEDGDTDTLYQTFDLGFYSPLARTVEGINFKAMPAKNLIQQLQAAQKKGQFRLEEAEDMGLFEWLEGLEGQKVTKEQVAQFIEDGGPKIEEVKKGYGSGEKGDGDWRKDSAFDEDDIERYTQMFHTVAEFNGEIYTDKLTGYTIMGSDVGYYLFEEDGAVVDPGNFLGGFPGGNEYGAFGTLEDAQRASNIFIEEDTQESTKYKGWTLLKDDTQEYREVLMTVPMKFEDYTGEVSILPVADGKYHLFKNGKPVVVAGDGKIKEIPEPTMTFSSEYIAQQHLWEFSKNVPANVFDSTHWGEKNVFAHYRVATMYVNGLRTLVVEEVQSDWATAGRREGFKGEEWRKFINDIKTAAKSNNADMQEVGRAIEHLKAEPLDTEARPTGWAWKLLSEATEGHNIDLNRFHDIESGPGVLDMPFKKSWAMLATKRVLRLAAEEGYEAVAWTPGQVHADRYNLRKQVETVQYDPTIDGGTLIAIDKDDNPVLARQGVKPDEIEKYLGKGVAERLMGDEAEVYNNTRTISGGQLEVGGKWAYNLYDKQLPKEVQKYVKTLDKTAKVGKSSIPTLDGVSQDWDPGLVSADELSQVLPEKQQELWHLPITDKMRQEILAGQPLYAKGPQGPKGSITFHDFQALIQLFKGSNKSTLAHEVGHLFRRDLEYVANLAEAPEQVRQDWATACRLVGAKPGQQWTVAQEEKWAKWFERYLAEGVAPSVELRSVFFRFRRWMAAIYKQLKNIVADDEMDPEVRGIFDRLLATDEEIAVAHGSIQEPLWAEMPPEVQAQTWDEYQKVANKVQQDVEEAIEQRRMQELAELQREWRKEGRDLAKEDPRRRMLRKVIEEGGLDLDLVKQDLSAETAKQLSRMKVASKKGKLAPDTMAQQMGFEDGEALIDFLLEAPTIEQFVESYVQANVAEWEHAQQNPSDEAVTDSYLERLEIEEKMIAEALGDKRYKPRSSRDLKKAIEKHTGVRQDDHNNISEQTALRVKMQAAARASREAFSAGKKTEAIIQKRKQRMLAARLQSRVARRQALEKFKRTAKRLAGQKAQPLDKKGGIGWDYQQQIRQLISHYYQLPPSHRAQDDTPPLRQFIEAIKAEEGLDEQAQLTTIPIAPWIMDGPHRPLSDMSTEDIQELTEALKVLAAYGRNRKKLLAQSITQYLDDARQMLIDQINTLKKRKPEQDWIKLTSRKNWKDKGADWISEFRASLLSVETLCRMIDGEDFGPWYQLIFAPIYKAETESLRLGEKYSKAIAEVFDRIPTDELKRWRENENTIPGLPEPLTKEQRICVALNSGNEGNWNAIVKGYGGARGWTEEQCKAILDTLTREDWQFVRDVWDIIDSMFELADAAHFKMTGRHMLRVERTPVETKFGRIEGGYYPLKFDPKFSEKVASWVAKSAELDFFGQEFSYASVDASHTIKREGGKLPPLLELDVIPAHISTVIHHATHGPAVRDVQKLLAGTRGPGSVRQVMVDTLGREVYAQFMPWLKYVAKPDVIEPGSKSVSSGWRRMRMNTTTVMLGAKAMVSLLQFGSFTQTIRRLGVKHAMKGLERFFNFTGQKSEQGWKFGPWVAMAAVNKLSPAMAHRSEVQDRELRDRMKRMDPIRSTSWEQVRNSFFYGIRTVDAVATYPTWIGAYEKAMQEFKWDEARAIEYADKIVRATQPTAAPKDIPEILKGGEIQKAFTMFYTFFCRYHQELSIAKFDKAEKRIGWPGLFEAHMWLTIIPATWAWAMRQALSGGDFEPEEIPRAILLYYFGRIPYLRDVASLFLTDFGAQISPVASAYESIDRFAAAVGSKGFFSWEAAIKAIDMSGYLIGAPSKQAAITLSGARDLLSGETDNPFALLFRQKKEKK